MVIAIPSHFAITGRIHLLFGRTGVIHVVTAVITAKGANQMTTKMEENAAAPATATDEQPKATKKATRAPRRAHVAPKKGKTGKKAKATQKAPKGGKKAGAARDRSKAAKA